ncbi:MAG: DNA-processing protein DprA [Solirubrobacterales bacterium]
MSRPLRPWTLEPGARGYPASLTDLRPGERPRLHGLGDRSLIASVDERPAVTIVGSRNASGYGLRIAERLGHDLALAGITVVSGLARGIDAAAHRGALEGGGGTVAVLACGPEVVYPASNAVLHERVLRGGALISEHPPGTAARRGFFVRRNRIMAALSAVTVIVEAAQPSGSLVTADRALELGRTVGAVPGQVGIRVAEGANDLIRDGAHLIRDAADVLDLLYGVGVRSPPGGPAPRRAPGPRPGPRLDPELAAILGLLSTGCSTVDQLAAAAAVGARETAIALARLERLGYVAAEPLGGWSRTGLREPE